MSLSFGRVSALVLLLSAAAVPACEGADSAATLPAPAARSAAPPFAGQAAVVPVAAEKAMAGDVPGAGDVAPAMNVATADGEGRVSLDVLRGRSVVLDFWATWCGPCRREILALARIHEEHAGDDRVAGVSISLDEEVETLAAFLEEQPMGWTQSHHPGRGSDGASGPFDLKQIPTCFVTDPEGKILHRCLTADEAGAALNEALAS